MKKILSMLGVVTITGTGLTTLTSNNFLSTNVKSDNICLKTKKILNDSNWSKNVNLLEVWYKFLASDDIIVYISHNTWQNINFAHSTMIESEFSNYLFGVLNDFLQANHSGGGEYDEIQSSDIIIMRNIIVNHYKEINTVFLNKKDDSRGIGIKTNRNSYWYNNPNDLNWGVHPNSEKIFS